MIYLASIRLVGSKGDSFKFTLQYSSTINRTFFLLNKLFDILIRKLQKYFSCVQFVLQLNVKDPRGAYIPSPGIYKEVTNIVLNIY